MERPLVSIITPTYNRADLLAETIESVLGQDYPRMEYLVLDDGSSDSTIQVLESYSDNRLRWYHHSNMGETRTVNRGFSLAKGEILCVLSSDDPLLPGAVRSAVDALQAHPQAVVVCPDYLVIDKHGTICQQRQCGALSLEDMVPKHECGPGPAAFFRASLLDQIGPRDPEFRYVADFDFWLRAAGRGHIVRIPRVLACFREHEGSISSCVQDSDKAEEHLRLVEKIFAMPESRKLSPLRLEAYATAHYVAGVNAIGGGRRFHFAQALRYFAAGAAWRQVWWRLPWMLLLLFEPFPFFRRLRQKAIAFRYPTPWRGRHYRDFWQGCPG
jgi:glycosyltransferase involved in cell wall biosynthesis